MVDVTIWPSANPRGTKVEGLDEVTFVNSDSHGTAPVGNLTRVERRLILSVDSVQAVLIEGVEGT